MEEAQDAKKKAKQKELKGRIKEYEAHDKNKTVETPEISEPSLVTMSFGKLNHLEGQAGSMHGGAGLS